MINAVYQDSNEIVWIATDNGLNRFDGSKFTTYKNDKKDPNSLLSDLTRVVYEDSQRRLFIGFFNGLQLYDHATDTFEEIPLLMNNGERFPSHVLTVLERQNGDILVGTSGQGIHKLEVSNGEVIGRPLSNIPSDLIKCLYEDKDQNLWISTEDRGLLRIDEDNKQKAFFHDELSGISSLCEDMDGNLYAGSLVGGFYIYDARSDSFKNIPYGGNANLPVKTLYLTRQNQIYIGTDGNGLKIYDPDLNKIVDGNFNVATFDFSRSKIHSIIEDNQGNTWAGIFQKGVLLLPSHTSSFNYIGYKSISKNWIGSNCIMSVFQDHEKTLWVGTDNDGLYGISLDGKKKVHFTYANDRKTVPPTILSIYEDSDHNLWLGSYLHGMARLNRKTGEFEYLQDLINIGYNDVQRIFSIVEDDNKNLWIGTMGLGVYRLNLNTLKIKHFDAVSGAEYRDDANILPNAWINALLISRDKKLYIGTVDGLGCYDLEKNDFTSVFGTNKILSRQIISALTEDEQGNIWAGSSEGLLCIERTTHRIKSFTMDHGLPSNVVRAIAKDSSGILWISTSYGISRFNLKDSTFTNYYSSDGLQGNEFSMNAVCATDDNIVFGGISGLTAFHPSNINNQRKRLNVRITDFYIHDQPVRKGTKSGPYEIIDTTIIHAEKFHLAHQDNSFSIEFSAMDFNNPQRKTFMYAMNDDAWITLQPGTNRITFSNLSPDDYIFKLKAKDFNSVSEEKSIAIIISPPWYFSVWAKITYFFAFTFLVFLIVKETRRRKLIKQKMMEHEHAEQINQAKLQLYINISHEIRTPMSLIVSPLKKLMSIDTDNIRQGAYQVMNRSVERILLLINQLMDVRKIEQGQLFLKFKEVEMAGFVKDVLAIFEDKAQSKNINLTFQPQVEQLKVWIDPKNFDKVIINVLSNAFKFTPEGGDIRVWLSSEENKSAPKGMRNYCQIIISDTGEGINEKEIDRVFERFYQVQNGQTSYQEGTGIGLHLTHSLVSLHHGTIRAQNNDDGKGCRFIIHLPLGNSHLTVEEMAISNRDTLPVSHMGRELSAEDHPRISSPKSRRRILIVDDDEEIRKYICSELGSDYHMLESVNGKEAYEIVLKSGPDLIISDIMMPEEDGILFCRKVKQNINVNHIPVILLTAKGEEEDNLEGLETGAEAYIVKPFNIQLLKKTVQNILKNREMLRNNFTGSQSQKDKIEGIVVASPNDELIRRIMDAVNENIGNPNLTVEVLAREIGISRVHLHRKLKELTNQSARDFLRNIRLQQAANLLSSSHHNISEVAFAVGFSNVAHFSSSFKKLYGVSPTEYMDTNVEHD